MQHPKLNPHPETCCNPINIAYQYQDGYRSRESADPAAISFRGDYYLFASHGSGYWWSPDLTDWHFVYVSPEAMPDIGRFAPGVCVIGDAIYITHSGSGSIYKSSDPKSGRWEFVSRPVGDWGDPAFLVDDDGRVYCYYGCSPVDPIRVVELDPAQDMAVIAGPFDCLRAETAVHGFEVPGEDNTDYAGECWLEGAWMTRHDGRYYLQYAAPGTQFATYADGCYVSDSPVGPFTYCDNSPVTFKAGGFLTGAGHGSLLEAADGRFWKFDTVSISVNHMFERRLVMCPAAFDRYGQLVANLVRADYPAYTPASGKGSFDRPGPDWHLVSGGAAAAASSELDAAHAAERAAEESMRSWWSAQTGKSGEWLRLDLGKTCAVRALQINFADQDVDNVSDRRDGFCYRYTIEYSPDGETWELLVDHTDCEAAPYTALDTSHDYYELLEPLPLRFVRITNRGPIPAGGKFAVSGLRLFGNGGGKPPAAPVGLTVSRETDTRSAAVSWDAVPDAEGYILRYGSREDSLYIHQQVIGGSTAAIHNLNTGVDYWFTVDSYNDSGYTEGAERILC